MANIKTSQEQDELHRAIWAIANDLRGSVDGWDFKSYVLGTMFCRYISEHFANYLNEDEHNAGNTSFDYASMTDKEAELPQDDVDDIIRSIGFYMKPSQLFCNVRKHAKNDPNLNETIEKVFNSIEETAKGTPSEKCFSGLFDDFDVNSNKLGASVESETSDLSSCWTELRI